MRRLINILGDQAGKALYGLIFGIIQLIMPFLGQPEDIQPVKVTFKLIFMKINLSVVEWATNHQFDYISFCSMFPFPSAGQCEIVSFDTVKKARTITDIPFFLAGGINLNNINLLSELSFNGIAVISGIMSSADIPSSTKNYINELNKITKHAN